VINVGIVSAATTRRLVPDAVRIDSPSRSRYAGTSRNPPPFARRPVTRPTAAATVMMNIG